MQNPDVFHGDKDHARIWGRVPRGTWHMCEGPGEDVSAEPTLTEHLGWSSLRRCAEEWAGQCN